MKLYPVSICAALCVGLALGQLQPQVYRGTLVHSRVPEQIEVLQDYLLGFNANDSGRILFVAPSSQLQVLAQRHGFDMDDVITLSNSQFLIPGLVDCHIHSAQLENAGTAYNKAFFDWLSQDFFPVELRFDANLTYARETASLIVRRTLQHGTTTASYNGPFTVESSMEFARVIGELNQRAIVGITAVDIPAVETAEEAINRTQRFVPLVRGLENPLIQPMVLPSFLNGGFPALAEGLGRIAREMNVTVQTHAAESEPIEDGGNLTVLGEWQRVGLLPRNRMLAAHGAFLRDNELELFRERGLAIAHCPNSNLNFMNGILNVRKVLDMGIKIGLGTDVSAGYSPSILNAMRVAIHASKALSFTSTVNTTDYQPLTHHEVFYLATLGGAQALGLGDTIGNFEVGKQFDALLIDTWAPDPSNPVFYTFQQDTMAEIIEKFVYLSDERNILRVFVAGRDVTPIAPVACSATKAVMSALVLSILQLLMTSIF